MTNDPSNTVDCARCGAPAARAGAQFCDACGARLDRANGSAEESVDAIDPLSPDELARRFEELEGHPALPRLLELDPTASHASGSNVAAGVIGVSSLVFGALALTIAGAFFFPPMAVLPLAGIAFGAYALVHWVVTQRGRPRWKLQRVPAFVLAERTKIVSTSGTIGSERHLAELAFRDGTRRELAAHEDLAGRLTPGTGGVAFVRGTTLVDFAAIED